MKAATMMKLLFAAAAVLSLSCVDSADAASKRKRHAVRHYAPVMAVPALAYGRRQGMQTPGPVWAGPGECYTDEGYGRYWPCGAGRSN